MSRRRRINKKSNNFYEIKKISWNKDLYIAKGIQTYNNEENDDKIYLITQFFVPKEKERYREIKETLSNNINNDLIEKIYMFNEKHYSGEELGTRSNKIEQIITGKRMTYLDAIKLIRNKDISGYFIITNSDIFFDVTLTNIKKSNMHKIPIIQSLLRYEYRNHRNLEDCPIFGDFSDSQDTWIIHSNFINLLDKDDNFDVLLGWPGCDQTINYRFHQAGFEIYNDPKMIRSYHHHKSEEREYKKNKSKPTERPYLYLKPKIR